MCKEQILLSQESRSTRGWLSIVKEIQIVYIHPFCPKELTWRPVYSNDIEIIVGQWNSSNFKTLVAWMDFIQTIRTIKLWPRMHYLLILDTPGCLNRLMIYPKTELNTASKPFWAAAWASLLPKTAFPAVIVLSIAGATPGKTDFRYSPDPMPFNKHRNQQQA